MAVMSLDNHIRAKYNFASPTFNLRSSWFSTRQCLDPLASSCFPSTIRRKMKFSSLTASMPSDALWSRTTVLGWRNPPSKYSWNWAWHARLLQLPQNGELCLDQIKKPQHAGPHLHNEKSPNCIRWTSELYEFRLPLSIFPNLML